MNVAGFDQMDGRGGRRELVDSAVDGDDDVAADVVAFGPFLVMSDIVDDFDGI
jgi:hypothetical protein